jgi:adenylate cyclase
MFLDLIGSTRQAEALGEVRVHDFITRFFREIDSPIVSHRGEVHAYVGDAVIITWPLDEGLFDARCLDCFFAIEQRIAKSASSYEREFGIVPRFSAAVHAGPVVVSECCDSKRQIAYFGDALNVTARLQEESKLRAASFVASGDIIKRIGLPPWIEAKSCGHVRLRGREAPFEPFVVREMRANKT